MREYTTAAFPPPAFPFRRPPRSQLSRGINSPPFAERAQPALYVSRFRPAGCLTRSQPRKVQPRNAANTPARVTLCVNVYMYVPRIGGALTRPRSYSSSGLPSLLVRRYIAGIFMLFCLLVSFTRRVREIVYVHLSRLTRNLIPEMLTIVDAELYFRIIFPYSIKKFR